jgi:hypothetical protein
MPTPHEEILMAPPLSDRSDNDRDGTQMTLVPDLDAEPVLLALVAFALVAVLSGGLAWLLCWFRH